MDALQSTVRSTVQHGSARRVPRILLIIIGWFVITFLLGAAGVFDPPGAKPPIAVAVAVALPPLLVVALLVWSRRFRDWARSLDLQFLTMLQAWRTAGLAFLALQAADALPATFAAPAGLGDVLVGVTAPLVAVYLVGGGRLARVGYLGWTAFGVLDLVNAVALGVLHSNSPIGLLAGTPDTELMAHLPMSLIPTFGVPLTLALHAITVAAATGPAWPASTWRRARPKPP
jgi:hypothetical protein